MGDASLNDTAAGDSFLPSTSNGRLRSAKFNECVTYCDPLVLTQLWKIENFHTILKLSRPGQCFRSQVFRDQQLPDVCWQLCLYPNGKREENKDNVSLFLKMSATVPNKEVLVKAEYRFYFLDDQDHPRFSNVNIGDFHAKPPKGGHSWGLRNIPKQKVASAVRQDNSLVVSCIIELMPDVKNIVCKRVSAHNPFTFEEVSQTHLQEEHALLKSGEGSDFTVVVDNTEIPVHSHKLCAHSAVFRAMLSHGNMQETKDRTLSLEADPTAVKLMLEYIYCGRIVSEAYWENFLNVMILAEKYEILDLKSVCEQQLISSTVRDNVCEILPLAEFHRANTLYDHCLSVVASNKNGITKTETWKRFREEHPRLCAEVLECVIDAGQSPPPPKRSRGNFIAPIG
ncbi:unnamed protein product, partial [Mesorhabditis spiculigera]